jgi:AraC-like DNA-binding protein
MPNPTVAAGYPKALLEFAVSRGANRATLLERSHLCLDDLKNPEGRIPLTTYIALMKVGIELCDEPALALVFGEVIKAQDISSVGLLGETFGNLESGRALMNRYARLIVDPDDGNTADVVEFVPENGDVWLKFTSDVYRDNPLLTESALARGVCGVRAMLSSMPDFSHLSFPKAIRFTHEEPSYRAEYDRIFEVPLFFGSHMNALLADKAFLHLSLPPPNPHLSQVLTAHAEELLKSLESSKTTRGKVEKLLTPNLHTGAASVDMIARQLGVSRQTLFRRLKAEGITFEKVLDELRHTMALKYLRDKKLSVNETAYLVGFSDPAAFSHAFKRWTGSSPRVYVSGSESSG